MKGFAIEAVAVSKDFEAITTVAYSAAAASKIEAKVAGFEDLDLAVAASMKSLEMQQTEQGMECLAACSTVASKQYRSLLEVEVSHTRYDSPLGLTLFLRLTASAPLSSTWSVLEL